MRLAMILGTVILLSGCGGANKSPQRFSVDGEALFDGMPIPVGAISFTPDKLKGHPGGPGVSIEFRDGIYRIDESQGVTAGPHTIILSGFESRPRPGGLPADVGNSLFPSYHIEHVFSAGKNTLNFEVPK